MTTHAKSIYSQNRMTKGRIPGNIHTHTRHIGQNNIIDISFH